LDKGKLIVFAVTNDLSYDQRMQRHCAILSHAGFRVLLIGRGKLNSIPLPTFSFDCVRLSCYFEKGKLFYLEYNLRLFLYSIRLNADAYAAVDLDTLLPFTLISKIKGKKLVIDLHEYFSEVPELIGRPMVKRMWEKLAEMCIPKVHLAYTVGPALAEKFSQLYSKGFHYVLNVPSFNPNIRYKPKQEKYILYQGALNKDRGLEKLIKAMPMVNAKLYLAGGGDVMEELMLLVGQLKLQDKVKFLGWIKPDELVQYTQNAFIGCNILERGSVSYEYSLANKFFDYIHAGVPQICANFEEYKAIQAKYEVAILVEADVQEIIEAINKLFKDSTLYKQLQNNCAKAAQVYNLQIESEKLIQLYHSI
jgi:glycosyltransferase involved in cell wall biosynthesis